VTKHNVFTINRNTSTYNPYIQSLHPIAKKTANSEKSQPTNKRIEYRGKNVRASRTGGVAGRVSAHSSATGTGGTINTNKGVRLHQRLWKGTRVGLQNGNTQFIGRWKLGRLNVNQSKSGFSGSVSNSFGSYNFLKPRYSSFKVGGVQMRGKNAATLQAIVMVFILAYNLLKFGLLFAAWFGWFVLTFSLWVSDVIRGFARGFKGSME